jgi:hypothetical protein
MVFSLYTAARNSFLKGEIDWEDDTIKVALIDAADYTVALAEDVVLDDVPSAAIVATETLANTAVVDGAADADNVTFSAVSGDSVEGVLIYQDTGDSSTSRLIVYGSGFTGLPFTPNGGAITITFPNDAVRIFQI